MFLLLLLPSLAQAQIDSTLPPRSEPSEYQEPATVDAPEDDLSLSENENDYFLNKWEAPEDSLFVQRKVPDRLVKRMQEDDDFWYANAEIEQEEKKSEPDRPDYSPLGQQSWFQTLLWLVIFVGFVAAILWYLAGVNVGLFRRKNKIIPDHDGEEPTTEDLFAINYQKEIDKAEAGGNYRLAIRLMFLRLLKDMTGKNIIQYKQDRTNLDYLLQLHPTVYYDHFFRITRNYEYSWYGKFEVGETAYRIIRNDFEQFKRQLQ
jgi:hypothetical protein